MNPSENSERLKKRLIKKIFNIGDWIILSEEAIEYLNCDIPEGERKVRGGTTFRIIRVNPEHRVWDVMIKIDGKNRNVSSEWYRLATEEEINRTQLKQMFEK